MVWYFRRKVNQEITQKQANYDGWSTVYPYNNQTSFDLCKNT